MEIRDKASRWVVSFLISAAVAVVLFIIFITVVGGSQSSGDQKTNDTFTLLFIGPLAAALSLSGLLLLFIIANNWLAPASDEDSDERV